MDCHWHVWFSKQNNFRDIFLVGPLGEIPCQKIKFTSQKGGGTGKINSMFCSGSHTLIFFPQQQNFAMGSLAQISSGAIRCSFNTRFRTRFRRVWCRYLVRFRRVPVQIPREIPEGSGEDTCWGSGGFCAVPEGSGADTLWCSGGFRWRYLVRFRKVPVQRPCEVPVGSGADALWNSKGFRCFLWHKHLIFFGPSLNFMAWALFTAKT